MKTLLNICVLISCILIVLGPVSAGWAANYYVDYAGGHESASGANPTTDPATGAWKYCPGDSRSSKSLSSGDTVYFKRGVTYLGTAPDINGGMINTVANNVTYTVTNWGTGQAILDGGSSGEAYAVIKIVHDNITVKGLSTGYELRITGTQSEHGIIVPADEGSNRKDFTFSYLEVDHIGTAGVGYGGDGIKFGGGTSYGVQGATISYNKIHACYQYGLKMTGAGTSGIDIHHNDIYGCAANNVYGTCQVNISSNAGQGVQTVDLHHNTIHDPYDPGRHYGVESNNVNNDIRDNEIYNNLVGIACDPSYNTNYTGTLRIYRNWIHDNTERGINISGSGTSSSRNVLAYNNKMKNNGSWEVHLDTVSRNNQFYNNTIYTSAFGFHILSGGDE